MEETKMLRMPNLVSSRKPKEITSTEEGGNKYGLNGVAIIGVVLGLMVMATMAFAQPSNAKWAQQVFNPAQATLRSSSVSIEELCPTTPDFSFTVPDPTGDTFGFGPVQHDITLISAKGDASTFCLTVEFAGPVDPADAGTGQEVVGFIEFDTDENATTGFSGGVDFFCPNFAGIGVDATLDMFSVSGGFATIVPSGDLVPIIFNDNSFTAVIPLSALGGDNSFNFAKVLGTFAEPTDCAPNGGSIHSPNGSIVTLPTIGSISGRVVDAATADPLRGDVPPFASVELRRCTDSACSGVNIVSFQFTDSEGRFLFNSDFPGNPLIVGTYQVAAIADQFQQGHTSPFDVGEGENRDVGEIPLTPNLIQFSEISPCDNLPPEGGQCSYSVSIRNNSSERFRGEAWSVVDGFGLGSFIGVTTFQINRLYSWPHKEDLSISPGENKILKFRFRVPDTVANGASICTRAFVGQSPTAVFNTVAQRFLFRISKGVTGFTLVPENKARQMLQKLGALSN
jgi:hypothetical protein